MFVVPTAELVLTESALPDQYPPKTNTITQSIEPPPIMPRRKVAALGEEGALQSVFRFEGGMIMVNCDYGQRCILFLGFLLPTEL